MTHEQEIKKKEFIKFLKRKKIPQTEWVFHLDDPETWDWDNSLQATGPFGPLNVGTDAVLSAASSKIPLWVEYEHLNMYRELKMSFRAMRQAEKNAIRFIEDIDWACALGLDTF